MLCSLSFDLRAPVLVNDSNNDELNLSLALIFQDLRKYVSTCAWNYEAMLAACHGI